MFVIGEIREIRRKVQFDRTSSDGKKDKADFVVTLRVQPASVAKARKTEIQEFWSSFTAEMARAQKDPEYRPDFGHKDLVHNYLHEDVLGLDGIKDAAGVDVEYSSTVLDAVLEDRDASAALVKLWNEVNMDDPGGKRKN